MKDVSVDLETMGTDPDAPIIAIGAVEFDIDTGELGRTFYHVIDLQSSLDFGARLKGDTIYWWMMQSEGARKAVAGAGIPRVRLDDALSFFKMWLASTQAERLWAHGTDFDISIMKMAYVAVGWPWPMAYNAARDTRSAYDALDAWPDGATRERLNGLPHHALEDAKAQALTLTLAWKKRAEMLKAVKDIDAAKHAFLEAITRKPADRAPGDFGNPIVVHDGCFGGPAIMQQNADDGFNNAGYLLTSGTEAAPVDVYAEAAPKIFGVATGQEPIIDEDTERACCKRKELAAAYGYSGPNLSTSGASGRPYNDLADTPRDQARNLGADYEPTALEELEARAKANYKDADLDDDIPF